MPFIEVNGANLFYETYGQDRPGQAPIVLIHGSTVTGQADWAHIAPLLARRYRVIVPDCRGHGQSSNPHMTYSFKEMAADTAALIRALGYERAHLIGHSNGGNVVLVALLEHPEVVQTCIPQAANAYVSQDLIEKEPRLFDPDRVARESPGWMNEMIALHGPYHGRDYWRDLLRLTVQAIISEPNYTAEDLARVTRPTLVIQGENDSVNAPMQHGQFIAKHIPHAELWLPQGVGHNVHLDATLDWLAHVLDFLERRGDDANDALYRLRRTRYADDRQTVFELRAAPAPQGVTLSGQVLTQQALDDALQSIPAALQPASPGQVQVLLHDATPWALVNRPVTDLRSDPARQLERVSQALLGESVRILRPGDPWTFVRLERDGYLGWIQTAALQPCSPAEAERYTSARNALVIAEITPAYHSPLPNGAEAGGEVGKLPFGVFVHVARRQNGFAAITMPDGRLWWLPDTALLPLSKAPRHDREGIAAALKLIRRLVGVPYLWGGRTPFGYDCSGLAQAFYALMGIVIPRDADQQFYAGIPVEGPPQPGDLLFFGSDDPHPRRPITHVAISLGGEEIIHANGAAWGISYNSLDPYSPTYRAWLKDNLVGVRRFE